MLQFKPHIGNAIGTRVTIDYTNWRGERSKRDIGPLAIEWGSNEWHKEPQFLLSAWCFTTKAKRCFAIKDIHSWEEEPDNTI